MNEYSESELKNGLKIIVGENRSSSVVTMQLLVKAGSSFESEQELGFAHILEHMLLKGTVKRPTSLAIGLEIDRIGAYSNAFTSYEAAWFVMQAASAHVEKLFDVMSDNILHSLIDSNTLENEKKVIIGEFHERGNMLPRASMIGALQAYTNNHPIARDPLGLQDSIRAATPELLRSYFSKFYIPNNCALLISGNIGQKHAVELVNEYFGGWKEGSIPEFLLPKINFAERSKVEKEHVSEISYVTLCYGVHNASTLQEVAAIELILSRLGYGYSSVLSHELRSKQGLSYGASTSARYYRQATILCISAASKEPNQVIDAIDNIVESQLIEINESWIKQMNTQVAGIFERKLADPFFDVQFIRENFNLFDRLVSPQEYLKVLSSLTPEHVRDVFSRYFDPKYRFAFVLGKK